MPHKYGNLKGESLTGLCDFWHPSVHLDHKSESGCKYGDKCKFLNTEAGGQPSKKLKERWRKRIGGFVDRDSSIWLCLMIAFRERRCCGKIELKIGVNSRSQVLQTAMRRVKYFGKRRVHRTESFKSANLRSEVRGLPKSRKGSQDEILEQERYARRDAWELAEDVDTEAWALPAHLFDKSPMGDIS